jgi:hypothetical protein
MCENGRIPRLQGQTEATLTAVAELSPTTRRQPWARPPIDVDFQVLMFTASGLLVRFLKVYERSGYQSVKWVRYLTRAQGTYQIRVSTCTQCIPGRCTDINIMLVFSFKYLGLFVCMYFRPLTPAILLDLDTSGRANFRTPRPSCRVLIKITIGILECWLLPGSGQSQK